MTGKNIKKAAKTQKIKAKKISVPPRDLTKESYDYACALVEEMNSNNKAFGEVLSGVQKTLQEVKEKGDATFEQVGILTMDVAELKSDVSVLKSDVGTLKSDVAELKSDVSVLKSDVVDIRSILTSMDLRLDNIENEIASLKHEFADIKSMLVLKADIERVSRSERKLEYMENFLKANYSNYQVSRV